MKNPSPTPAAPRTDPHDRSAPHDPPALAWAREFLPHYFTDEPAPFHAELLADLDDPAKRLIARIAPRGHAKSTCASLAYPLYAICERKRRNIVIVSHESSLAVQFVRDIRTELETNEKIIARYGNLCPADPTTPPLVRESFLAPPPAGIPSRAAPTTNQPPMPAHPSSTPCETPPAHPPRRRSVSPLVRESFLTPPPPLVRESFLAPPPAGIPSRARPATSQPLLLCLDAIPTTPRPPHHSHFQPRGPGGRFLHASAPPSLRASPLVRESFLAPPPAGIPSRAAPTSPAPMPAHPSSTPCETPPAHPPRRRSVSPLVRESFLAPPPPLVRESFLAPPPAGIPSRARPATSQPLLLCLDAIPTTPRPPHHSHFQPRGPGGRFLHASAPPSLRASPLVRESFLAPPPAGIPSRAAPTSPAPMPAHPSSTPCETPPAHPPRRRSVSPLVGESFLTPPPPLVRESFLAPPPAGIPSRAAPTSPAPMPAHPSSTPCETPPAHPPRRRSVSSSPPSSRRASIPPSRPKWSEAIFTTTTGITVQAKGSGAAFRGIRVGPQRPDLIICDDIEKDDHVETPDGRRKLEHWLRRVVMPALAPDGRLVVVGSLIHYDSLLANLCKPARFPHWNHKTYRAIESIPTPPPATPSEPTTPVVGASEPTTPVVAQSEPTTPVVARPAPTPNSPANQPRHASCRLAAQDREAQRPATDAADPRFSLIPLWPARWPLEKLLDERARIGTLAFEQEYQANPIDTAQRVFRPDWLRRYDPAELTALEAHNRLVNLLCVDPATGRSDGDHFALWAGSVDRLTGTIYTRELSLARIGFVDQVRRILAAADRWKPLRIGIETVAYQDALRQALEHESRTRGLYLPVVPIRTVADKLTRIQASSVFYENGVFRLPPTLDPDVEAQFLHFPKGKHDDAPDVCALAIDLARASRAAGRFSYLPARNPNPFARNDW